MDQLELATAEYVDWFNFRRLYETWRDISPAELEQALYAQQADLDEVTLSTT